MRAGHLSPRVRVHARPLLGALLVAVSGAIRTGLPVPIAHYRLEHGSVLNDPRFTPGATRSVAAGVICRPGYASAVRDVNEAEKAAVYREYGIVWHRDGDFEVDHLIPLELGGANTIANLWPEPNDRPAGYANSKDRLEDALHRLVCSGRLALVVAQREIASDWVRTYRRVFGLWPARDGRGGAGAARIVRLLPRVARGASESLVADAPAAALPCTLAVVLPSGRSSTAPGIGTAVSNRHGVITWRWPIAPATTGGLARAGVRCFGPTTWRTFVIL